MRKLLDRITVNPRIMAGKPVVRGTRITVDLILELLAAWVELGGLRRFMGLALWMCGWLCCTWLRFWGVGGCLLLRGFRLFLDGNMGMGVYVFAGASW